jgi:hypothetical protein
VPLWAYVVVALFGGGFLKAVVDLIRDRDRYVWGEIKRLNEENRALRRENAELKRKSEP